MDKLFLKAQLETELEQAEMNYLKAWLEFQRALDALDEFDALEAKSELRCPADERSLQ
jgi:hypothetical protein